MYDHATTKLNHTMLRITNPQESLDFYALFGLTLIEQDSQPAQNINTYYLAFNSPISTSPGAHWTSRQGVLELQHHYTDTTTTIHSGNTSPKGYGHICISVDNVQAACRRLEDLGVPFKKRLSDGRMHFLAFALDPDGYWVEMIARAPLPDTESITTTDTATYRIAHTMLRVKDPKPTLAFYQDVLGMTLLRENQHPAAGFGVYFLGYPEHSEKYVPEVIPEGVPGIAAPVYMEGLLELTWNYGTEKEEGMVYWNGTEDWNGEKARGFGHVGLSVGDVGKACEWLEEKGVKWVRKFDETASKEAVMMDPDGYAIEVVQDQGIQVA